LPTYQRAALLRVTLETLVSQAYCEPYEVIVLDDGSTDATAEVVGSFPRCIRYVPLAHQGLAAMMNEGIRLARGEYVMLTNDHDLYAPETLSQLASALDAHPAAVLAVPDVLLVTPNGNAAVAPFSFPYAGAVDGLRFMEEQLLPTLGSIAPHNMWRAEAWFCGEEDGCVTNDLDIWLRLSARGAVVHVPRTLVRVRDRDPESQYFYRNHCLVAADLRSKRRYLGHVADPRRRAALERSWRPKVDRSAAYSLLRCLEGGHREEAPAIADLVRGEGTRLGATVVGVLCRLPVPVALVALRALRVASRMRRPR
jgi:GalNAc5-diNAcBac-PP-undecaprenol beta-1,3-glucosyltransferase